MLAIGIPTLNESKNIEALVRSIDLCSQQINIPLVIINSDNNSEDGTSKIFKSITTYNKKVPLTTKNKGKGRNIQKILNYIIKNNIEYCIFIDGDILSFNEEWLTKYLIEFSKGSDYIIPNYSRYYQEGNTTNHFIYPLLNFYSMNRCPFQPIAGDFGISRKFAKHLQKLEWVDVVLGYGVDVFMTINAIFNGFKVTEISLDRKIHNPSFDKIVPMFGEVAESYYDTISKIPKFIKCNFEKTENKLKLLDGEHINKQRIDQNIQAAKILLKKNRKNNIDKFSHAYVASDIDANQWAEILYAHEQLIGLNKPKTLSKSITPYFLLRVATYLNINTNANEAGLDINKQTKLIYLKLSSNV